MHHTHLCICFPLCREPLSLETYMAASLAFGSQAKCPLPILGLSLTTYLKKALLSYHRIILFHSLSSSYRNLKFFYVFHLFTCFLPKSWELDCLQFVLVSVIPSRPRIKFLIGLCWTNEQISVSPSPSRNYHSELLTCLQACHAITSTLFALPRRPLFSLTILPALEAQMPSLLWEGTRTEHLELLELLSHCFDSICLSYL